MEKNSFLKPDPNKKYCKEEDIKIEEVLVSLLIMKKIITEEEYLEVRKVLAERKNDQILKEMENNPGTALFMNLLK